MTQQRTFPENVSHATASPARKESLHPCPDCGRACLKERCYRCRKLTSNPKAIQADIPRILTWAREIRTEEAITAYARKKVAA